MRRYLTRRNVLLFLLFLLAAGSYIYNLLPHKQEFKYTYIPASGLGTVDENAAATATPTPTKVTENTETSLNVRGTVISLGDSEDSIIDKLGVPSRIDDTEYDFNYYIYDNDYSRLLFVAVRDGKVVGFYSDSLDFSYMGITSGSDISTVRKALNGNFPMSAVITADHETYTVDVLLDNLDTQKVTGINILDNSVKIDEYTEEAMKANELMVFDLTNSIRVRHQLPALSWSTSAAIAARKHSSNMANNKFFSHIDPERQNAGDRIRAEGVYYKTHAENIIGGYGTAILSTHAWFNSSAQRKNILSEKFRYLGVGFAYVSDSPYQSYFTQNFYR